MSWDSAPVVKKGGWDSAPVASSKARAAEDARKRSASTPGLVRALSQGASLGFSDEIDAGFAGLETAANNAIRRLQGKEIPYTSREARDAVLASERNATRQYARDYPVADFAYQAIGGAALPVGSASTSRQAIGSAAALGGAYGYGSGEGAPVQRLPGAIAGAVAGGATAGLLNTVPRAVGSIANAARRSTPAANTPVARLRAEGVSLTPGQRIGGLAKTFEDRAMGTVPILGDAIRGARLRGNESLQRAATNRALRPIGAELPANVEIGTASTAYARDALSDAYDAALSQVEVAPVDDALISGLQRVADGLVDLPEDMQGLFRNVVQNRITSRFENGVADGATLKDIQSQIGRLASEYGSAADPAQQRLGSLFGELSDELLGLAARNSPDGGAALRAADEGYANYVRVRNAGGKLGAESGRFTPAQLRNAVRAEDSSVARGRFATGESLMYDLADDASSVMSSKVPDSGTAGRIGLGALGATALTNPSAGIPTIAGLTAAAAPYFAMGRSTPEALQRVIRIAEQAATIGRPPPAAVRNYLADARTALGASHPFVQQLEALVSPVRAAAEGDDTNAPAVTVETVGDMSVADWLRAQEQPR